jgi:riboflavin synthase
MYIQFKYPAEYSKYVAEKASVAVNGVSLTVAFYEDNYFTVSLIPHTLSNCNLTELKPEDSVNLEFDILSKYIERLINTGSLTETDKKKSNITLDFLKDKGF